jgi:hypothetical protein
MIFDDYQAYGNGACTIPGLARTRCKFWMYPNEGRLIKTRPRSFGSVKASVKK